MLRFVFSAAAIFALVSCSSGTVKKKTVLTQERVLTLEGPEGARCLVPTPEGDIVLERAPGQLVLPAKYGLEVVQCFSPDGTVTKILAHTFVGDEAPNLTVSADGKQARGTLR